MESEEGAGSVFTVWLPMRTRAVDGTPSARQRALPAIDGFPGERTALVVEDDPSRPS
jgi:hypothetical protein